MIIDGWEKINASLPPPGITQLRWVVAHVPFITREYAEKLKALGGGVSVLGGWRYISGTAQQNGPPFKMLKDSRHPDGHELRRHADLADEPVARALLRRDRQERARRAHQRGPDARTRNDAIHLYTAANGWFLGEEKLLGTIEPGKYADLVVLSGDYFDRDGRIGRGDQEDPLGADRRRRQDRARRSGQAVTPAPAAHRDTVGRAA